MTYGHQGGAAFNQDQLGGWKSLERERDSLKVEVERLRCFRDAVVEAMVENAGGGQPFAYIWQTRWDEIKAAVEQKGR